MASPNPQKLVGHGRGHTLTPLKQGTSRLVLGRAKPGPYPASMPRLEAHAGVNSGPSRGAGVVRSSHNVSSHLRLLVLPHVACHCDPSFGICGAKRRTQRDTSTRRRVDLFAAGSADLGETQSFANALTSRRPRQGNGELPVNYSKCEIPYQGMLQNM